MRDVLIQRGSRIVLIIGLITFCVAPAEYKIRNQKFFENVELQVPVEYAMGLSLGIRDFVVENAECVFNLIVHPLVAIGEMIKAFANYQLTYLAVKNAIANTIEDYPNRSLGEKARLQSRLISESFYMIGLITVPVLGLSKIGWIGRIMELSTARLTQASQFTVRHLRRILPKRMATAKPGFSMSPQQPIGLAEWFAYESPTASY